jgi:NAD(P)-dependent dehydrogenase (short-subunit alcohol dehydrogenase family)
VTSIKDKVVAVTGAGSGIGRALASALYARGAHVALSDVNEQALAETAASLSGGSNRATTHRVDVRDRAAVEEYARAVRAAHGGADIIINNAGVTVRGSVEELSYEDFRFVIDVNLWGVVHGTRAFLPLLRERGQGHIVNIASINAMVPFAKNGPYNMSKYAVYGLNETLMQELRGQPIRVTSVHPGGIRTNIARNAKHVSQAEAAYFDKIARTSAPEAAEVILHAVERNRERCFIGADARMMAFAKRVLPGLTVRWAGAFSSRRIRD